MRKITLIAILWIVGFVASMVGEFVDVPYFAMMGFVFSAGALVTSVGCLAENWYKLK